MMKDNYDPKDGEDDKGQAKQSPNEEKEVDDNDVQRGLTGETDDEEDVGGDLAGNAGGNA
ncbi:hypothetical protein [Pedobacter sp. BMA]|uniref:hypothetical protein n=1 Tax=Pedobacter sp. BMA TaxID=1663685 RepID=UPI0012DFF2C6|nr:hypothetical protein [Pedobacter sp. BMA]